MEFDEQSLGSAPTMTGGFRPYTADEPSLGSAPTIVGARATSPAEGAPPILGRIDQYELIRKLGGGGFGVVYLARDTVSGIKVAIKTLHPLLKSDAEEMERLREKFALVSRLSHPNIASALVLHPAQNIDIKDENARREMRLSPGDNVMVMRYAPGVTLSRWRRQFPDGKVPLEYAGEIAGQIASALDYAHSERIVHRDIKPANVMVETLSEESRPSRSKDEEEGVPPLVTRHSSLVTSKIRVRILDFGLAAEIRSSMARVSTAAGDTSGTRPYMAPEQWTGVRQDGRTDQYALACVIYDLLAGAPPFAGVFETGDPAVMLMAVETRPPEPVDGIPASANAALARALSKKQSDRFDSCGAFANALAGREGAGIAAGQLSRTIQNAAESVKATLDNVSGNGAHGTGLLKAAIAAVCAILGLWFVFRGCGRTNPKPMVQPPIDDTAELQKFQNRLYGMIPNRANASIEELVKARENVERLGRDNPRYRTLTEREVVALEGRVTEQCGKEIAHVAEEADKLAKSVAEFQKWNDREKCEWQRDSQKAANKFTENFSVIKRGKSQLESLSATMNGVEKAHDALVEINRAVDWIRRYAPKRENLAKLEAEFNSAREKILKETTPEDVPAEELATAQGEMETSKAFRDRGEFEKAENSCKAAINGLAAVKEKALQNKDRRICSMQIENFLDDAKEAEKTANGFAWHDKAYEAQREKIRATKNSIDLARSSPDKESVDKARKQAEEAKKALQWMKDHDAERCDADNASADVTNLKNQDFFVEAGIEEFAATTARKAATAQTEAARLVDDGKYHEAAAKFRESKVVYIDAMAEALVEKARRFEKDGKWRESAENAKKALDWRPDNKDAEKILAAAKEKEKTLIAELDNAELRLKTLREQALGKGVEFLPEKEFEKATEAGKEVLNLREQGKYEDAIKKADEAKKLYDSTIEARDLGELRARAAGFGELVGQYERYRDPEYVNHFREFAAATNDVFRAKSLEAATKADKRVAAARDWIIGNADVRKKVAEEEDKAEKLASVIGETDIREREPVKIGKADAAKAAGKVSLEKGDFPDAVAKFGAAFGLYDEAIGTMRKDKAAQFLIEAGNDWQAGRWNSCLKNIEECLRWDPENSKAFDVKRDVMGVLSPKKGDRRTIHITDRRDTTGATTVPMEFVYNAERTMWETVTPVTQDQWLAVGKVPMRFAPEKGSANANFINTLDAENWIATLAARQEFKGWKIIYRFRDGSSFGDSLNVRKSDSCVRVLLTPVTQ